jgi:hypothetical protein
VAVDRNAHAFNNIKVVHVSYVMEAAISARLDMGIKKYGHGVRVNDNTRAWGTSMNSWLEMAREEFLDAVIYVVADYIRQGRSSRDGVSKMEAEYGGDTAGDDNGLISFIVSGRDRMEACRHKVLLWNLANMLRVAR